jgi:hypothetical protein
MLTKRQKLKIDIYEYIDNDDDEPFLKEYYYVYNSNILLNNESYTEGHLYDIVEKFKNLIQKQ